MEDQQPAGQEDQYTVEEAVEILERVVQRKRSEVEELRRKGTRLRNEDRKRENDALIAYLEADATAYVTVIADMTDDDSLLEGIDLDADPVEAPENYQQAYLDGLSADDLQDETDADSIRADYCDQTIMDLCTGIGETALKSKKIIKAMLDDPYAVEQVGEVIFFDDYLYDLYKTLTAEEAEKDKAKKKKKKKRRSICRQASTRGSSGT